MDHKTVYDRLISRARGRTPDGYSERHHVVPKCVGGTNKADNIVRLTPEEHFVAHQLLVHMYPETPKLIFALRALCMNTGSRRPGNKVVGWMRRRMAEVVGQMKSGVPRSPVTVEKQRQSLLGRKAPPDQIEKIRAALKGKPKSPEHNAKVGRKGRRSPMTGRAHSEETKAKMRAAALARPRKAAPKAPPVEKQFSARGRKAAATLRARGPADERQSGPSQPSLF
jgi:hypothetical protein